MSSNIKNFQCRIDVEDSRSKEDIIRKKLVSSFWWPYTNLYINNDPRLVVLKSYSSLSHYDNWNTDCDFEIQTLRLPFSLHFTGSRSCWTFGGRGRLWVFPIDFAESQKFRRLKLLHLLDVFFDLGKEVVPRFVRGAGS